MDNDTTQQSVKKLYVGSLPYSWSTEELEELFKPFGTIASAAIVSDQVTRRSKGFGFVEMESEEGAKKAMEALNGKDIEGRQLAVREARPHVERGGDRNSSFGSERKVSLAQSLDDAEQTDTSGRGYGNRRGWW